MARDRNQNQNNESPADTQDGLPVNGQADGVTTEGTTEEEANPNPLAMPQEVAPRTPKAEKAATVAEGGGDERFKTLTVSDGQGGETTVKRKEAILNLWTGVVTPYNPEGKRFSRSAIANWLTNVTGKKVAYQIVFQATNKIEGGPPAAEGESVPSEGATETASAGEGTETAA